jgi:hypothetical protein
VRSQELTERTELSTREKARIRISFIHDLTLPILLRIVELLKYREQFPPPEFNLVKRQLFDLNFSTNKANRFP